MTEPPAFPSSAKRLGALLWRFSNGNVCLAPPQALAAQKKALEEAAAKAQARGATAAAAADRSRMFPRPR